MLADSYSVTTTSSGLGAGFWITYFLVITVVIVVAIAALWRIFEKAGRPGWAAIVPFYNSYLIMEIAGYNGWLFLITLIPFVGGLIYVILTGLGLAKNFGKSTLFAIFGLMIFNLIGYLILGFGKDQYIGASSAAPAPASSQTPTTPPSPSAM